MLHFFLEVERSEEEKGGGGFNVSPQIRQIDQFATRAHSTPHGPDHPSYPGEGAARSGSRKKKPPRLSPQRPRVRALPIRKELT